MTTLVPGTGSTRTDAEALAVTAGGEITAAAPHVPRLLALAAACLGVGLVAGRVELVVLAAPLVALCVHGLTRPLATAGLTLLASTERCVEGEDVALAVRVRCRGPVEQVDLEVALGDELRVIRGSARVTLVPGATPHQDEAVGEPGERLLYASLAVRTLRWGVHTVGPVRAVVTAGGRTRTALVAADLPPLRVLPRAEAFDARDELPYQRALTGSHPARAAGEGVELEAVRPAVPGDDRRRVNHKVTARTGRLHVTVHRPERNAEVVVLVDAFTGAGAHGRAALDVAVRAAVALAEHYLSRGDRVGVVGFGTSVRWLVAGTGAVQRYRVVEHLLGTVAADTYAWRGVEVLPARALPPRSLVMALSPLLDERPVTAFADLARRGHAVCVVDVAPDPLVPPVRNDVVAETARQVYLLEREGTIARLGEVGVPVVRWLGAGSLDAVLVEVARQHARPRVLPT